MAYEFFYKFLHPFFKDDIGIFNVFKYITFRAVYAAVMALILSFIFGPRLIRFLKSKKLGQPIRKEGPETHFNKSGTPTMGGILILGVIVVSTLFFGRLDNVNVLILIFATVGFGLIGFVDDYKKLILKNSKGLSGWKKLLFQFIIAGIITTLIYNTQKTEDLSLYMPFMDESFKLIKDMGIFFIPFGMIILVGSSNAVNLTDGLDGLAIGLLIFVGIAFGVLAYLTGHEKAAEYLKIVSIQQAGEITVYCAAFVGAGMGFLWFNSHPAQVFMGDTGSLALGGVIGVLALMLKKELLLVIIGGIFVAEALSVIIQVLYYKWKGKRIFKMAPIHHHFELSGWPESKVIIRFWIIGATLALIALSTLKIQGSIDDKDKKNKKAEHNPTIISDRHK